MNLLAFDTSTEALSIAVSRTQGGQTQVWTRSGAGGAQASSGLIAGILELMQQAGLELHALDAICFGSGPGSFTGLRTACSVAQGLAFGARVPVLPVESLLAVAEEARHTSLPALAQGAVVALLDARMDELYAAIYAFDAGRWTTRQAPHLVRPQALQVDATVQALAGNVFTGYGERLPAGAALRIAALPTATALLRLAPQLLAQGRAVAPAQALPLYIRDNVAKTTLERAAEKAAAQALAAAAPLAH